MKNPRKEKQRMSYETFSYLNSLISKQLNSLETDFRIACDFVSQEKDGVNKAHKVFMVRHRKLRTMQDELRNATSETYRDHPKKEMREFWGITE